MLTLDTIISLSPSAADLEKAKPLSSTKKWRILEANEQAVWEVLDLEWDNLRSAYACV